MVVNMRDPETGKSSDVTPEKDSLPKPLSPQDLGNLISSLDAKFGRSWVDSHMEKDDPSFLKILSDHGLTIDNAVMLDILNISSTYACRLAPNARRRAETHAAAQKASALENI